MLEIIHSCAFLSTISSSTKKPHLVSNVIASRYYLYRLCPYFRGNRLSTRQPSSSHWKHIGPLGVMPKFYLEEFRLSKMCCAEKQFCQAPQPARRLDSTCRRDATRPPSTPWRMSGAPPDIIVKYSLERIVKLWNQSAVRKWCGCGKTWAKLLILDW